MATTKLYPVGIPLERKKVSDLADYAKSETFFENTIISPCALLQVVEQCAQVSSEEAHRDGEEDDAKEFAEQVDGGG